MTNDPKHSSVVSGPAHSFWLRRPVRLGMMLLLLLAVEGTLRLGIMARSDIPAQDGTYFLDMAKMLRVDPAEAKRRFVVHPGYPAAVVAAHSLLGGRDDPRLWERAGRAVAFVAGLGALAAIWTLGTMLFRDVWIGWAGALLFGLGRKFAAVGADVLSDSLMLCLAMWASVVALRTAQRLEERRHAALLWAAATGLLAGAAYWVRPEGAVAVCLAATTWLTLQLLRGGSWLRTLGATAAAVLTALLAAAPYGMTGKWQWEEFTAACPAGPLLAWLGATGLAEKSAALQLVGKFFEAQHPILASLTCGYAVLWCAGQTPRGRRLAECLPTIAPAGGVMIVLTFFWVVPPIVLRYLATGALSHRYLFLPAAMLAGTPAAAILGLTRLATGRIARPSLAQLLSRFAPVAAVLGLAAGLFAHALRPLHADEAFAQQAGLWLSERIAPGDGLLTDQFFTAYYSGATRRHVAEESAVRTCLARTRMKREEYWRMRLDSPEGYRYVALTKRAGQFMPQNLPELLESRGYRVLREFPYVDEKGRLRPEKQTIVIFHRP